jgi:2-phospho-L-lactate transferase/gluconeogenesis factor (CofD/UPF0052 family)
MNGAELNPLRITLHGGGGGLPEALEGISLALPDAEVTAIVATGDAGSKTGETARTYGTVAVGDAWKTVKAVSKNGARKVLDHRFGSGETDYDFILQTQKMLGVIATTGANTDRAEDILMDMAGRLKELPDNDLEGYTFGGLALTALTLHKDNLLSEGLKELSVWAAVPKNVRVMPTTNERHDVVMWDDGEIIYGEEKVDIHPVRDPKNARVWLQRSRRDTSAPAMYSGAYEADAQANIFTAGPGSLWTSIIASMAVDGMEGAVAEQDKIEGAVRILMANANQERDSTKDMLLSDYLVKLQGPTGPNNDRPITGRPFTDVVHDKGSIVLPEGLLPIYCDTEAISAMGARALGGKILRLVAPRRNPNDPLAAMRSEATGVRHDMRGVVDVLAEYNLVPAYA